MCANWNIFVQFISAKPRSHFLQQGWQTPVPTPKQGKIELGAGEERWIRRIDPWHKSMIWTLLFQSAALKHPNQSLAESAVTARVNGALYDLDRPLEGDASLEFLDCSSPDGQTVFWHSSAHVLGAAAEHFYRAQLCHGASTETGFFYDMYLEGRTVRSSDLPALEETCKSFIGEKLPFERVEVSREDLLRLFQVKSWVVLRGAGSSCQAVFPRQLRTPASQQSSSTFWQGDPSRESLQRVYGISFPTPEQLAEWEQRQEEAASRDHRRIGQDQELFFFHELSPGNCFFLPRGAHIYNTLIEFIKSEYWKRGFSEVVTPNIYDAQLWERSGHWQHYSQNMFHFPVGNKTFALKPMNCPGHCLMFAHRPRSWRELPLRLADFGALHRNEPAGALAGLTRVCRFQQDDAHIFCTMDQLEGEINGCLEFLQAVYSAFGFSFHFYLATRPDGFLGDAGLWERAEQVGLGRDFPACACGSKCVCVSCPQFPTILCSKDGSISERPVMIHRAVLGSVERMTAILAENYGGKWPLWLSPFQIMVIPVGPDAEGYAHEVSAGQWHRAGFMADADVDSGTTFSRKIRKAQLARYNFQLVVGRKEMSNKTVNVRPRDTKQLGERDLQEVLHRLQELRDARVENAEEIF
uniref:threonine--tRNA ligase n=1 Tax=Sphenodon punctatus TaxID=8508 RepID=A0A8D0L145_SPHPU